MVRWSRNAPPPKTAPATVLDRRSLGDRVVASVVGYCGLWFIVFTLGTLALASMDIEPPGFEGNVLLTAGTSVLATLNNIGPGLAGTGPWGNFAFMPEGAKLLLSLFMILGRLEFYAVVALFAPRFWHD